jgi:acetyl-CoA C-acetyltransferase
MRRAAIVNPVRTPVGAFGGALRPVPVETLGGIVANARGHRCEGDAQAFGP